MTEEPVRLQKLLAQAGVASRRASEDLIKRGHVKVDGETVTEMGLKVSPESKITVDGERIHTDQTLQVWAFYKPVGTVSTMQPEDDRPTLGDWATKLPERVFHVGRLDAATAGLILMTNNGELANRLTHPSYEVPKTYVAIVQGQVKPGLGKLLKRGVELEDGVTKVDKFRLIEVRKGSSIVELTLHSGKNRVVRRLLSEVGHPVSALTRISIGPLGLKGLKEGQFRLLDGDELAKLQELVDL
ncbi:MAG: rRNA pseudouridine synthase [Mobiluncus sp.]|uniref:Pseudouridine synthase n=1 Tax=Mobiluncus porci TaxID=2652278 RepID=A0A7K0JZL2_9ACTO|nr:MULTISPECIES: pseudouridine synthase [Mobiluncus]MCI6584584.1 rRNA pseudouridine synthase [Mobiluncus sp.]MST48681.1 rRNA pseudouridine synthase [Mobiluncus porci]